MPIAVSMGYVLGTIANFFHTEAIKNRFLKLAEKARRQNPVIETAGLSMIMGRSSWVRASRQNVQLRY